MNVPNKTELHALVCVSIVILDSGEDGGKYAIHYQGRADSFFNRIVTEKYTQDHESYHHAQTKWE